MKRSFTPTYGFRIGEMLTIFKIEDFPVIINTDGPSPWQEEQFDFNDDFIHFSKPSTSDIVFQKCFHKHKERNRNFVPVYTDGSKFDNHVGSAEVFPDTQISEKLHPFCSVFTSELYAIYLGLVKIAMSNFFKFIIYTDSKTSIAAFKNVSSQSHPLVIQCLNVYNNLKKYFIIRFCWIPGHVGIRGNEKADNAAKGSIIIEDNFVPLADVLQTLTIFENQVWQSTWERRPMNKLFQIQPSVKGFKNPPFTRKYDVILTRLQIGHAFLTHNYFLHSDPAPLCNRCNCILTIKHIICGCRNFNLQLQAHFGAIHINLKDILGDNPHVNLFFLKKKDTKLINLI
ncbi:hypothetical protein AVEN_81789-1 [Araneus ventricosus]|uniref:RNase H type-1 domain-containing protein n=1 Tax=Araneus ventricosus TaxID=182803 RepID=A0A4Y2L824_ARAVE|nr:hypothetical protein AVEN_81789-1 [Araneus ventricosus]